MGFSDEGEGIPELKIPGSEHFGAVNQRSFESNDEGKVGSECKLHANAEATEI